MLHIELKIIPLVTQNQGCSDSCKVERDWDFPARDTPPTPHTGLVIGVQFLRKTGGSVAPTFHGGWLHI